MDIKKVIIDEIKRMPISRYRLSKETGINESILSRLVRGEKGLTLENAEKLLEYFDLIELKNPAGNSSQREVPRRAKSDGSRQNAARKKKKL